MFIHVRYSRMGKQYTKNLDPLFNPSIHPSIHEGSAYCRVSPHHAVERANAYSPRVHAFRLFFVVFVVFVVVVVSIRGSRSKNQNENERRRNSRSVQVQSKSNSRVFIRKGTTCRLKKSSRRKSSDRGRSDGLVQTSRCVRARVCTMIDDDLMGSRQRDAISSLKSD